MCGCIPNCYFQRLASFLVGHASHVIADALWHGFSVEEGLIMMLAGAEFNGDSGASHTMADTGKRSVMANYNYFALAQSCHP